MDSKHVIKCAEMRLFKIPLPEISFASTPRWLSSNDKINLSASPPSNMVFVVPDDNLLWRGFIMVLI